MIDLAALSQELTFLEHEVIPYAEQYTADYDKADWSDQVEICKCHTNPILWNDPYPQIVLKREIYNGLSHHQRLQSGVMYDKIVERLQGISSIIKASPAFDYPEMTVDIWFYKRTTSQPRLHVSLEHKVLNKTPVNLPALMKRFEQVNHALLGYDRSAPPAFYTIYQEKIFAHSPVGALLKYACYSNRKLLDPANSSNIPEVGCVIRSEEMAEKLKAHLATLPN